MNETTKKSLMTTGVITFAAILFTILISVIDVQPIGPEGTKVGFAALNGFFFNTVGTHKFLYVLTQILGVVAILTAVLFAIVGAYQLYTRKDIYKVDKNVIAMGGIYILVILLYIIFDKFPVNYRPVILDEGLEASYPSTHTMLAISIFGCALVEFREVLKKSALKVIQPVCLGLIAAIVIGRLFSGVHWFTDIVGGVIISAAIVSLYQTIVLYFKPEKKKRKVQQNSQE